MIEEIQNKVLKLWVVTYDGMVNRTYFFTDQERVIASVDGSIREYAAGQAVDGEKAEITFKLFISKLKEAWPHRCIPAFFSLSEDCSVGLQIVIIRLEIDRFNPFYNLVAECAAVLSDSGQRGSHLANKLISLFGISDSAF